MTYYVRLPINGPIFFYTNSGFIQIPINKHATFKVRVFYYQYVVWTDVLIEEALEISFFVGYRIHLNIW